jgi:hypothetical protein
LLKDDLRLSRILSPVPGEERRQDNRGRRCA